jgi:hypothetical protein
MQDIWKRELPRPMAGIRNKYVMMRNNHQTTIREVQHHLQVRYDAAAAAGQVWEEEGRERTGEGRKGRRRGEAEGGRA